ncbi:hypothetical protein Y695_00527 [Hydrogenophaga sp. T4]|nr:hypothetical protein Y695_00527 [Hydrogenophaga sp. T4]
MKISKSAMRVSLPIVFFGIPFGLGNNLAQPIAMLLLLPLVWDARRHIVSTLPFTMMIIIVSTYQAMVSEDGHSIYQALRSGIPFAYFYILLAGYKDVQESITNRLRKISEEKSRFLDQIVMGFSIGQFAQVVFFRLGINLANAASSSSERVLLFPTTSTLLIFFYACCRRNIALMILTGLVVMASGSKAALVGMLTMSCISLLNMSNFRKLATYSLMITGLAGTLLISSPLALERLTDFVLEDQGSDITREYEIAHAKESFLSGPDTLLFGKGLAAPLTPGVPTTDERWFDNSKYDIENGYWSLVSKLGIVGIVWFGMFFRSLPHNLVSLAVISILCLFALKTSYQFFTTFDGSYLLIWSITINYLLTNREHSYRPSSIYLQRRAREKS